MAAFAMMCAASCAQQGNNNAYCQDSEVSWFDWTLLAKHADVHRLVYWQKLEFDLPPTGAEIAWRRWIDTTLNSPEDIVEWQDAVPVLSHTYREGPPSQGACAGP